MNLQEAIRRPGIAKLDYGATTFSFSPDPNDPFTVFWDVTDIAKRLAALNTQVIPLPLEGLEHWFEENRIEIDRNHAMSIRVDSRVPILAVYFDDGILPVDGWHRIYRSLKLGWQTIPTLLLEGEEEYRFRYPQSLCDKLRDLSRDPGYRLLEQCLEKALRSGRQLFVMGG